jgi:RimJ/RimL family protein N-acetyltransferase
MRLMMRMPLAQRSINLAPLVREDFDRLISWVPTECDLVKWSGAFFRHPLTRAQLERYLESSKQPNARLVFTAWSTEGEAVGHVEISHIWPHLSSRLSRVLVAPHSRRRGLGSAMIAEALALSFTEHHVGRVDLGVSSTNTQAITCYEKVGFTHVGTWPDAFVVGTSSIDVYWMTVTCERWGSAARDI